MAVPPVRLHHVDAFTDIPFRGNPAAVCLLPEPRTPEWMQRVAQEMNLSETAFVTPSEDGFALRWFTPKVEVELCGHATLAAAHVLWECGARSTADTIRFQTTSGVLTAAATTDGITLDFPSLPEEAVPPPPGLVDALGVSPSYVGKSRYYLLVEVADERALRDLDPDMALLARLPAIGIIVTSRGEMPGVDFVSRFFGPAVGVEEDPVTGSAHCCLGPYWAKRLGKRTFTAFQASPRGGTLRVTTQGARVTLSGRAVTVFRGELLVGVPTGEPA